MHSGAEYRFDGWVFYSRSGELLRDGERIRLQKNPALILETLLTRPGELITRQELIAQLWPRGVVEFDMALNTAMRRLRLALADHADTPRYIETLARRGYRFIGTLDETQHRAVQSAIAQSVDAYRRPAKLIAGVVLVLAGLFAVKSSIPISALGYSNERNSPAIGAQALDSAERANFFLARRAPGDLARAQHYFSAAVARAPTLARAWTGLASVHWLRTVTGEVPFDAGLAATRDAADRALALDPRQVEAHLRLANYWLTTGDTTRAGNSLSAATRLAPDDHLVLAFAASAAVSEGRIHEAIELQQRAVRALPLGSSARYNLAWMFFMAGRVGEVEHELASLIELHGPDDLSKALLATLRVAQRDYGSALAILEKVREAKAIHQAAKVMALHGLDRHTEADDNFAQFIARYGQGDPYRVAEIYAFRGEVDRAFEWLQLDVPRWTPGESSQLLRWMLQYSPWLKSVREDRRWKLLVERAG